MCVSERAILADGVEHLGREVEGAAAPLIAFTRGDQPIVEFLMRLVISDNFGFAVIGSPLALARALLGRGLVDLLALTLALETRTAVTTSEAHEAASAVTSFALLDNETIDGGLVVPERGAIGFGRAAD